jgi:hypothetical protein
VFTKVERLFMLGLRAPDPALRRKFSALYARAVAATMYDRLNFVVVQQDWQAMAHQVGAARQGGAGQGGAQRGGAWRGRGGGPREAVLRRLSSLLLESFVEEGSRRGVSLGVIRKRPLTAVPCLLLGTCGAEPLTDGICRLLCSIPAAPA